MDRSSSGFKETTIMWAAGSATGVITLAWREPRRHCRVGLSCRGDPRTAQAPATTTEPPTALCGKAQLRDRLAGARRATRSPGQRQQPRTSRPAAAGPRTLQTLSPSRPSDALPRPWPRALLAGTVGDRNVSIHAGILVERELSRWSTGRFLSVTSALSTRHPPCPTAYQHLPSRNWHAGILPADR